MYGAQIPPKRSKRVALRPNSVGRVRRRGCASAHHRSQGYRRKGVRLLTDMLCRGQITGRRIREDTKASVQIDRNDLTRTTGLDAATNSCEFTPSRACCSRAASVAVKGARVNDRVLHGRKRKWRKKKQSFR